MTGRRCWQYGRAGCRKTATQSTRLGAHVVAHCANPDHRPVLVTKETSR